MGYLLERRLAMAEAKNPASGNRGGGRRPTGIRRVSFSVSCQPEARAEIRRLAREAGKTVSAFLVEAALGSPKPTDS